MNGNGTKDYGRLRHPAAFSVLALVLSAAVGCWAPSVGGSAGAPAPAVPGTVQTAGDSAAAARVRLEAALRGATAAVRRPDTKQIRTAITDAGFPSESVEVTASRTPTGLDADAVEAAVKVGRECIVAQLRDGTVTASVFPVLADGRCFVGTSG